MIESNTKHDDQQPVTKPSDDTARQKQRQQVVAMRTGGVPQHAVASFLNVDGKTANEIAEEAWRQRAEQLRMENVNATKERIEFVQQLLREKVKTLDAKSIDQWIKLCALENQLLNTALKYTEKQGKAPPFKIMIGIDMERI